MLQAGVQSRRVRNIGMTKTVILTVFALTTGLVSGAHGAPCARAPLDAYMMPEFSCSIAYLTFSDFTFSSTPATTFLADRLIVQPLDAPDEDTEGFQFQPYNLDMSPGIGAPRGTGVFGNISYTVTTNILRAIVRENLSIIGSTSVSNAYIRVTESLPGIPPLETHRILLNNDLDIKAEDHANKFYQPTLHVSTDISVVSQFGDVSLLAITETFTVVPEPSALALLLLGIAGVTLAGVAPSRLRS